MSAAPQRPAFVLIWIVAFTLLVGAGLDSWSPVDAATEDSNEAAYETYPKRTEIGPDDPRAVGGFHSSSDPAKANPVSTEYTRPRGAKPLALYGSVVDQNRRPLPGARVQLWLGEHYKQCHPSDAEVFSNTEGRFQMPPVDPSGKAVLVAYHNSVSSQLYEFELSASVGSEPLSLKIDFSTAAVSTDPLSPELTASSRDYHSPLYPRDPFISKAAFAPDLSVDLPLASLGAAAFGGRPRPEAMRLSLLDGTAADGSGVLVFSALFPEGTFPGADEDEDNEEAVRAALDALPDAVQDMLSKAKRNASEYLEEVEGLSGREKLIERLREARSRPRIAQLIARLSPRQMAKARRLLHEQLRARMNSN